MNIDLTTDVGFWNLNGWAAGWLVLAGICALVAVIAFIDYTKTRKARKAEIAIYRTTEDEKVRDASKEKKDQLTENISNAFGACVAFIFLTIILVGIALIVNMFQIEDAQNRQVTLQVQKAINETYDVEATYAEANMLVGGYSTTLTLGTRTHKVTPEDLNTKSEKYVSTESYGTAKVLQNDEKTVSVQLVRVKQEFRLVYSGENAEEVLDLPEVDKRQN